MPNLNERTEIDLYDDVSNPLDGVEEIMANNDWIFDRPDENCLSVQVSGQYGHYTMRFIWQDNYSAMKFSCMPDITISPNKRDEAARVISNINNGLWLGHFEIATQGDHFTAAFRHTSLFRGMTETSGVDHMEDLIDIAIAECERYHLTFDLLSKAESQSKKDLVLAMMDIAGRS